MGIVQSIIYHWIIIPEFSSSALLRRFDFANVGPDI